MKKKKLKFDKYELIIYELSLDFLNKTEKISVSIFIINVPRRIT